MEQFKQCLLTFIAITSLVQLTMSELAPFGDGLQYDTMVPVEFSSDMSGQWGMKDSSDTPLALNRLRRQTAHIVLSSDLYNQRNNMESSGRRWTHRKPTRPVQILVADS